MANFKLVNTDKLDADMTSVADKLQSAWNNQYTGVMIHGTSD